MDHDATVAEYHASRARYIRTVTADAEQRILHSVGKRREPLLEEIGNLALLAQSRYETYQQALNAYAIKAPGRVVAGGVLPPAAPERMIAGINKLYKAALRAADEFREVEVIVKKRKAQLEELDWKMRVQLEQYGRDLIAQLETPAGLAGAFRRDPLLGRAHARMVAAEARRASVRDSMSVAQPAT